MIFYFSATGNCKYVAQRLAEATKDHIISITDCMRDQLFSFSVPKNECIGILSPTYAWGLPTIVSDFLKQLQLCGEEPAYTYFVATYGTTPGQTGRFANEQLCAKNADIDAFFGVKMPDTWTPTFDLSNLEKVSTINAKAEAEIEAVAQSVCQRKHGDFMKFKMPYWVCKHFAGGAYEGMRKTSHFVLEDTCIGCGLCANKCPVGAIQMQDGHPVWVKEQCVMCLGCLHRCPKFAIQYDKRTKKHGQYHNPHVKI